MTYLNCKPEYSWTKQAVLNSLGEQIDKSSLAIIFNLLSNEDARIIVSNHLKLILISSITEDECLYKELL